MLQGILCLLLTVPLSFVISFYLTRTQSDLAKLLQIAAIKALSYEPVLQSDSIFRIISLDKIRLYR